MTRTLCSPWLQRHLRSYASPSSRMRVSWKALARLIVSTCRIDLQSLPIALRDHRPLHLPALRAIMLRTTPDGTSTSNFRTIFDAAIKTYEKKTKTDLRTHSLMTQLESCNSSSDILAVLQEKVNELDESRSHGERLSSWLNPIIHVLYSFSATLGQGVGLVSLNWSSLSMISPLIVFTDILPRKCYLSRCRGPPLGENPP